MSCAPQRNAETTSEAPTPSRSTSNIAQSTITRRKATVTCDQVGGDMGEVGGGDARRGISWVRDFSLTLMCRLRENLALSDEPEDTARGSPPDWDASFHSASCPYTDSTVCSRLILPNMEVSSSDVGLQSLSASAINDTPHLSKDLRD